MHMNKDISHFAVTDGLYQLICCFGATREETGPTISGWGALWQTQLSSLTFGTPVCLKTESSELMMERNQHLPHLCCQWSNLYGLNRWFGIKFLLTSSLHFPCFILLSDILSSFTKNMLVIGLNYRGYL